jgi:hypothetical protein
LRDVDCVVVGGIVRKENGRLREVVVEGKEMGWREVAERVRASKGEVLGRMEGCSLEKMRELLVGMFGVDDGKLV